MGWRAWARLSGLVAFLLLQLWPYPSVSNPLPHDPVPFPPEIREWMTEKCFDCHSNRTSWPWYSYIAPFSWWVTRDVRLGRAGFNFSLWSQYSPRQQTLGLRRSLLRIQEGRMPPREYTWMHPGSITDEQVGSLQEWIKERERIAAEDFSEAELLAWPGRALPSGEGPLKGVFRTQGRIQRHLVLQDAVLLSDGDLVLEKGVSGRGAILASGKVIVRELQGEVGPLGLLSLESLSLQGPPSCRILALLRAPGEVKIEGPQWEKLDDLSLPVTEIRERRVEFCRDDGEIGERVERQAVLRYGYGQFVIWDPEFQTVHRAADIDQALDAVERTLKNDPATSAKRWNRRFRKDWKNELLLLTKSGAPATLELKLTL